MTDDFGRSYEELLNGSFKIRIGYMDHDSIKKFLSHGEFCRLAGSGVSFFL
jgi:hypothetical protein